MADEHHDHVSLAEVLEVCDKVQAASITATEKEAVQRCIRALMVLPTYATCVSRAYP